MARNYLLVDYENVQPRCLAGLDVETWRVIVFVGAKQSKVSFELAAALQALGNAGEYVQISGSGRNALDFHIAFTMGRLATTEPGCRFHVLSKDSGFDPLLDRISAEGIGAHRYADLSEIPIQRVETSSESCGDRVSAIVSNLRSRGNARPRKRETLANTIQSLFRKSLSAEEIDALMGALEREGHISLSGDAVKYHLPEMR
ncbi:MAG: PIN domain-containing protein [Pseudomonadales bacterium]